MADLNDERGDEDRRAEDRRARLDRRQDRRNRQERRNGQRRFEGNLPEDYFPDTLEEVNCEIGALTAEIDRLSGQLVELLDRSRDLFLRRAELMSEERVE